MISNSKIIGRSIDLVEAKRISKEHALRTGSGVRIYRELGWVFGEDGDYIPSHVPVYNR